MRTLLRDMRVTPVRRPDIVVYCGNELLAHYARALEDEVWTIREQVLLAALDCDQIPAAEERWLELAARFTKDSRRVRRLQGLILEAKSSWGAAEECYKAILEETSNTDKQAHKRLAAICKARGNTKDAIIRLEEYLGIFQVDEEAHNELGDLHLREGDFLKACYCFEELVLGDPQNHLYVLKYAECLYSMGDKGAVLTSRKYFAQSIRLNSTVNNLRAYYGLWIACITLAAQHGMRDDKDNSALLVWAAAKLQGLYATHAPATAARTARLLALGRPDS
eukprot:TRINITY_DN8942_c0_g1_i1.p1 TRINITY_DN8942_c0_g1~~TRINITY_DN8942_c0_g1_i1.p1  ORF type:complete len:279 (+),score=101.01 TRINITY_DN8942_c0_g1_i1:97-933(+)